MDVDPLRVAASRENIPAQRQEARDEFIEAYDERRAAQGERRVGAGKPKGRPISIRHRACLEYSGPRSDSAR